MVDATASPQTIVFEAASADGFTRQEDIRRRADELRRSTFGAVVQMGEQRLNPDDPLGPGPWRRHRARAAGVVLLAELQHAGAADRLQRRQRRAHRADRNAARGKGPFRYAGIDDHYFVSMLLNDQNTQPVRVDYRAGARAASRRSRHHRPATSITRCASSRRRIRRDSSSARRRSTSCARSIPS